MLDKDYFYKSVWREAIHEQKKSLVEAILRMGSEQLQHSRPFRFSHKDFGKSMLQLEVFKGIFGESTDVKKFRHEYSLNGKHF